MSALGLQAFIDVLGSTTNAGAGPVTSEELQPVIADIGVAFTVINDVLDHADRQAQLAVTAATDAAAQIEKVGQDLNDITGHTYRVVIPHSLSWLAGYVVTTWIDPIRGRLDKAESSIRFILGWRGQIDTWRHDHVDPTLAAYEGFRKWFDTWPQGVLFKWHDWFQHPARFASWAAPTLVRPIVSDLGTPAYQAERDVLALTMVDAWSEVPNRTWEAILRWVVTDS